MAQQRKAGPKNTKKPVKAGKSAAPSSAAKKQSSNRSAGAGRSAKTPDSKKTAPGREVKPPVVTTAPIEEKVVAVPEGPERAGFALLLGRPNVGKSTLLNRLVGEHLAAVSPRPQTTRSRILGIVNEPKTQLCLLDVPGVHRAKSLINRAMVHEAMTALGDADVILYLAEAGWPAKTEVPAEEIDPVGAFHRDLLVEVGRTKKPTILVLTKVDLLPKPLLLPVIDAWRKAFDFREVFPLSALTGENVEGFVDVVREYLPEGDPLFPADMLTDQTERSLVGELIREQVFLQTREEVPYGTAVAIEQFDESERVFDEPADEDESRLHLRGPGLVRIEASIVVDRSSHKGIIIGTRGERLKAIGTAARRHIERLLGCRVWLGLHVRVVPGWTEKRTHLADFGMDTKAVK